MTSASGRQVRSVLWKELRRVYDRAPVKLGGELHKVPDAGYQLSGGREILGFSTDAPEKMAGFSGPNMLFLLDEASGIPPEIFEAIEGNRAAGARTAMFSNPTQTVGEFHEAFTSKRHHYCPIHVSSEETPNATGKGEAIPGLAGADWIAEKKNEWGEDSPIYQVRIKGNFPRSGTNNVISLALIEDAIERWKELFEPDLDGEDDAAEAALSNDPLHLGVDVARDGDDESVIFPRRGLQSFEPMVVRGLDGPDLAGKVLELAAKLRHPHERVKVKVDVIGIGTSCYDALARAEGIEAIPVNVAEAPTIEPVDGTPGFHNLRSQIWFGGQDWLKAGGAIPDDGKLLGELNAPLYGFDGQNRRQVEPKPVTKKRLGRSPDRADALLLAIYDPPPDRILKPSRKATNRWGDTARGFG